MYFDSQIQRTTRIIQEQCKNIPGFNLSNLFCIEIDPNISKIHTKYGIPTHEGSLCDYLSDDNDVNYSQGFSNYRNYRYIGAHFDFQHQILNGSQYILKFLDKHLYLQKEFTLSATFSQRIKGKSGTKGKYKFNIEFNKFEQKLIKKMSQKGYTYKNIQKYTYPKNMFFCIYKFKIS